MTTALTDCERPDSCGIWPHSRLTMVHGRTKRHSEELRQAAIRQFRSCQNVAQLAREMGIPRSDESDMPRFVRYLAFRILSLMPPLGLSAGVLQRKADTPQQVLKISVGS
jgi:hypothetical protein